MSHEPELTDLVAEAVWTVVRGEVAPVETRIAVLETALAAALLRVAHLEPLVEAQAQVRERVAGLEARPTVPGPEGAPGKDGADGLGVDELLVEHDGERTITIKAAHGERVRTVGTIDLPVLIYRQVWTPGTPYTRGDVVTLEGAGWHCHAATNRARPGTAEGAAHWQLMVKRGDRGKDAR